MSMSDNNVVDQYIVEAEKAQRVKDTAEIDIRKAIISAVNTTRGEDGFIKLTSLSKQKSIDDFVRGFSESMNNDISTYRGEPDDDSMRDDFWREYIGFTEGQFYDLIDQSRGKTSFKGIMLNLKGAFKMIKQNAFETPIGIFNKDDGEEVISYLKNASSKNAEAIEKIDVSRLVNPIHMAELVNEWIAKEKVSVEFVERQPYVIAK